jgi:hypothetical protein
MLTSSWCKDCEDEWLEENIDLEDREEELFSMMETEMMKIHKGDK